MSHLKLAIIGNGSWATALAKLFLNNCDSINWYMRKQEDVDFFKTYNNNPRYLSSVEFNTSKIRFYTDIEACFEDSETIILAVPSAFLFDTISSLNEKHFKKWIFGLSNDDIDDTQEAARTVYWSLLGVNQQ